MKCLKNGTLKRSENHILGSQIPSVHGCNWHITNQKHRDVRCHRISTELLSKTLGVEFQICGSKFHLIPASSCLPNPNVFVLSSRTRLIWPHFSSSGDISNKQRLLTCCMAEQDPNPMFFSVLRNLNLRVAKQRIQVLQRGWLLSDNGRSQLVTSMLPFEKVEIVLNGLLQICKIRSIRTFQKESGDFHNTIYRHAGHGNLPRKTVA